MELPTWWEPHDNEELDPYYLEPDTTRHEHEQEEEEHNGND